MRTLKVRRRALPGIGERFELDTGSGPTLFVVAHRSGRRDIALGEPGADEPTATASLSRAEAAAMATLLTGTPIHIVTTPAT